MTDEPRLRETANELLARIDKEQSRPPETPMTHLIGGIAKVGAKLEALLRDALEVTCAEQGRTVSEFLPVFQGRPVSLRRATAGQLARALERTASPHVDGEARVLVEDVCRRDSIIHRVVRLRNQAAHQERVTRDVADALKALRRLIERLTSASPRRVSRRAAGHP